MLTDKEISEFESLMRSLGIDLPEEIQSEIAGIAAVRFCLAKALREHQLSTTK